MPAEFVDTNILVYAYDRTAGSKFERARELKERLWNSGEGIVSTQVLEEFYVTVTAKIPNPLKLQVPGRSFRIWAHGRLRFWKFATFSQRANWLNVIG